MQILRNEQKCIQCISENAKNCPNPPEDCPVNALANCGEAYTVEELAEEIAKDQYFYDYDQGGVTFSGGEPLLYPEYLTPLLSKLKDWIPSIAIETCGNIPFKNFIHVIPYVDVFLFDLKIMDKDKFQQVCGGNLQLILDNLKRLVNSHQRIIPRIPLIPNHTDDLENLKAISNIALDQDLMEITACCHSTNWAAASMKACGIPYPLENLQPLSDGQIKLCVAFLESQGLNVVLGGK